MSTQQRAEPAREAAERTVRSGSIRPAHDLLMEAIDHGLARRLDRILRLSPPDAPPGLRSARATAYRDLVRYVDLVRSVASDIPISEAELDADGDLERSPHR